MTDDEIDTLWHRAMQESVTADEPYVRFRFARAIEARSIERCAVLVDTFTAHTIVLASDHDRIVAAKGAEIGRLRQSLRDQSATVIGLIDERDALRARVEGAERLFRDHIASFCENGEGWPGWCRKRDAWLLASKGARRGS
jgi:hypothetical protein